MKLKKNIAVSESGFVFDPTTGDSFSLNMIGLEIVELLREGKTDGEIIPWLLDKYDIDKGSLDKYYYDFISMLQYYQLIETSTTGPGQSKDDKDKSAT
ncbi:MAG: PqqD family protein [Bacteroidales bacterium]